MHSFSPYPSSLTGVIFLWIGLPRVLIYALTAWLTTWSGLSIWVVCALILGDSTLFWHQVRWFNRASEEHMQTYGAMAPVWGGYLCLLIAAGFVVAQWWALILGAFAPPDAELFTEKMDREHAAMYDLDLSADQDVLTFTGTVTHGLSRTLGKILEANPSITRLALDSKGGHIYEARGAAKLIEQAGISTSVQNECSSACTLMFMAGNTREIGDNARLGFHQYTLELAQGLPNYDPAKERARDRAYFAARGVSQGFLARMFDVGHRDIWYPTKSELMAAGVVTTD